MNEMDVLRAAQPDVPAPGKQAWDTALDRLAEAATERRPEPVRRWTRPRRLVAVGTLGAAAVVGLSVLPGLGVSGTQKASAAMVLGRAASYAQTDKLPTPKPGQWIYIESRERGVPHSDVNWMAGDYSEGPTATVDARYWLASTRVRPTDAPPIDGCAMEGKKCVPVSLGPPNILQVNGHEVGRVQLNFPTWRPDEVAFIQGLPTDRDVLLRQIYRVADQQRDVSREQEAFSMITDLLDAWAPPRLRAALFQGLAKVPGVTIDEDAVDYTGRHGVGFTRSDDKTRRQIILDRRTYRFLGQKVVAIKPIQMNPPVKPGTVILWTSQLRLAVVDKARQVP